MKLNECLFAAEMILYPNEICFNLSSLEHCCFSPDPVSALQGLGKTIGIPVITTTLGTPELLKGAEKMIRNSFTKKTKNWVVLQNCHLETRWSQEFLRLIEVS